MSQCASRYASLTWAGSIVGSQLQLASEKSLRRSKIASCGDEGYSHDSEARTNESVGEQSGRAIRNALLFLAVTGLRISEAIGITWSDFDGNVLRISRRIYEGRAGETKTSKSVRSLPIPEALVIRMRKLGEGQWVFRSRVGTTINPGNALKRYIHPASRELGFRLGGWHDFRHTMATQPMMSGAPTKVVSEILGHADVQTTMKIYQHANTENLCGPLNEMSDTLLQDVTKCTDRQEENRGYLAHH